MQCLIKKAFVVVKNETKELSCGSTFNICHDVLKIAHLLHKCGFVDSQLLRTVVFHSFDFFQALVLYPFFGISSTPSSVFTPG